MVSKDELEKQLNTHISQPEAIILASAVVNALDNTEISSEVVSPEVKSALYSLAGKEIQTRDAVILFGQGAQIGDVTVRDIVKGDIIYITVNIGGVKLATQRGNTSQPQQLPITLRRIISTYFSMSEVRILCQELGIDHEIFPDSKSDMVLELVAYLRRRRRVEELADKVRELRPDIDWNAF
jgi:hypothetical protein